VKRPLLAIFLVASAARLAFLFGADQPLLYTHQYTYFTNAMRIAEHPHALSYLLRDDEWRTWDQVWTIAPLYFVFLGGLFKLLGPHLLPVQLLQCAIGGATAAGVGALGRRVAGGLGLLAGVGYALYGPAIEMPSTTMTENVHTPLFVFGVLLLARVADAPSRGRGFAAGAVLGLSALARSVSTGFMAVGALYVLWRHRRSGLPAVVLMTIGGAAVILPWTARNVFITHDAVLIESAAFENIWYANALVDGQRWQNQLSIIHEQTDPAERRSAAMHFAVRGVTRNPSAFVEKIGTNFRHFFRPEGLNNLLRIEQSQPAWRHLQSLLLDDAIFFAALPLFTLFVVSGRPSATRALIVLWTAYYLFMIVVLFHNEIRYRSAFVPFLLPGAAGGWMAVRDGALRRVTAWLGLAVGLWVAAIALLPYAVPAMRALRVVSAMRPALAAADAGNTGEAVRETEAAAVHAPRSPRPWLLLATRLAHRGDLAPALEAYDRAAKLSTPASWSARVARPALLAALRLPDAEALEIAHELSWDNDPWLALEVGWRELAAPRTDRVVVGENDYGAVRGFLHPRGGDTERDAKRLDWNRYERLGNVLPPPGTHRWSRHRAWVRLAPTTAAARYDMTIVMGYAFPATRTSGDVRVRTNDGGTRAFAVDETVRPYAFSAAPGADGVIVVQIDAPTWCRAGEPAEQGVRVESVSVTPAR
jgi:hypothetical protein